MLRCWWPSDIWLLFYRDITLLILLWLRSLHSWFCYCRLYTPHWWSRLELLVVQQILCGALILAHRWIISTSLSIYNIIFVIICLTLFFLRSFFTWEIFRWSNLQLWYLIVKVILQVCTSNIDICYWFLQRSPRTRTSSSTTNRWFHFI